MGRRADDNDDPRSAAKGEGESESAKEMSADDEEAIRAKLRESGWEKKKKKKAQETETDATTEEAAAVETNGHDDLRDRREKKKADKEVPMEPEKSRKKREAATPEKDKDGKHGAGRDRGRDRDRDRDRDRERIRDRGDHSDRHRSRRSRSSRRHEKDRRRSDRDREYARGSRARDRDRDHARGMRRRRSRSRSRSPSKSRSRSASLSRRRGRDRRRAEKRRSRSNSSVSRSPSKSRGSKRSRGGIKSPDQKEKHEKDKRVAVDAANKEKTEDAAALEASKDKTADSADVTMTSVSEDGKTSTADTGESTGANMLETGGGGKTAAAKDADVDMEDKTRDGDEKDRKSRKSSRRARSASRSPSRRDRRNASKSRSHSAPRHRRRRSPSRSRSAGRSRRDRGRHRSRRRRSRSRSGSSRSRSRSRRRRSKSKDKKSRDANSSPEPHQHPPNPASAPQGVPGPGMPVTVNPSIAQLMQQFPTMSLQEIIAKMQATNASVLAAASMKPARELYVGNLPPNITGPQLQEFLGTIIQQVGLSVQPGNPILNTWISTDGHFAFCEMRSIEECNLALLLNQLPLLGQPLKFGRPKSFVGPPQPIPQVSARTQTALANLGCTPNPVWFATRSFADTSAPPVSGGNGMGSGAVMAAATMASMVPPPPSGPVPPPRPFAGLPPPIILAPPPPPQVHAPFAVPTESCGKMEDATASSIATDDQTTTNQNMLVMGNIPVVLAEDQVKELVEPFGALKSFAFTKGSSAEQNTQNALFEYEDDGCAEAALKGLNGLDLGGTPLTVRFASQGNLVEEMGPVVKMANMVNADELADDEEYADLKEDVEEECKRFGTIVDMEIPRPMMGQDVAGVGNIFVQFSSVSEAGAALKALSGRKFGGNIVQVSYFSLTKFQQKDFA